MSKKISNKNEIRAYFSIYPNEILPENITEKVGLQPSGTHLKGQHISSNSSHQYKDHLWEIKSQLNSSADIQAHVINILDQLRPFKKRIIQTTKSMSKELALTIFYYESRPSMHFTRGIIEELAEYELEMDFDIYFIEKNKI